MRGLLFIAGVQLVSICLLCAATMLYNERWLGGFIFLTFALGYMPALRIR